MASSRPKDSLETILKEIQVLNDNLFDLEKSILNSNKNFAFLLRKYTNPKTKEECLENSKKSLSKFESQLHFKFCKDFYSDGSPVDSFKQLIACTFYADAKSHEKKWNLSNDKLLWFACILGSFEALDFQAFELENSIRENINKLLLSSPEEKNSDNYIFIQNEIKKDRDKLSFVTNNLFPLHWEAGYVYAGIHQIEEAEILVAQQNELIEMKNDALSEEIKNICDETKATCGGALKNFTCASLLAQTEIAGDIPDAHNITNQEVVDRFNENPTFDEIVKKATDGLVKYEKNLLATGLGKVDAGRSTEAAEQEIKGIIEGIKALYKQGIFSLSQKTTIKDEESYSNQKNPQNNV